MSCPAAGSFIEGLFPASHAAEYLRIIHPTDLGVLLDRAPGCTVDGGHDGGDD